MDVKDFIHLHVHTQYSLLDGACRIDELVKKAKDNNMKALAITDHGVMYGAIEFYRECKKQGIKPILGVEAYVINGDINEKDTGRLENRYHLILLAENNEGYQNIVKLVSISHMDGFYYKPRMNKEMLRKYSKGIIALSGCLAGEVAQALMNGDRDNAIRIAKDYQDIFGPENFFLEMQANKMPEQLMVNKGLKSIAKELDIKTVVTCDVHYVNYEDHDVQDILMCIQTGKKLTDTDRMKMPVNEFYLKTYEEVIKDFEDSKESLINTALIAERCNVDIEFGVYKLPKYKFDEKDDKNLDSFEYLKKLCIHGIKNKYADCDEKKIAYIKKRLDYELGVISQMGFVDYFLIVWDFIKFAKDNDIPVGPGRGSAAGSLVSYLLNITEVDPIRYNLLFERFLNPERVSMPDIDIDFCNIRRQEVIDYVIRKYGIGCVTQIITFGTMAAKQVIRDVARVIDMPYADADRITKMIPFAIKMTLDKALELNKDLKTLYLTDEKVRYLIDTAKKLEGLPRHASIHAAGVVITDKPIYNYIPVARSEDIVVTEFNMTTIEELGLLKMDFLALRNLTVIKDSIDNINKNYNVNLSLKTLDINDSKVYDMISKGKTEGVFQLESKGMIAFLKELKPRKIEDLIAGISLYRPGPMSFIPAYLEGRKNPDAIRYETKLLEPILKDTYGTIVYQEQVMEIFRELAGYSYGRSDLVRRAMSKKKMDVMLKEKDIFIYGDEELKIEGAVKRGVPSSVAESIYSKMIDFAKYAFNKSHSACYAYVAYQTAYLKYHYPAEYMASLISSVENNQLMTASYIEEAKKQNIKVLSPDVNESCEKFIAIDGKIRFSLAAVKGVGRDMIENMVREREKGKFTSLENFISRMLDYNISKRAVEALVKVGAFDSLEGTRGQHLAAYIYIFDSLQSKRRNSMAGQLDLFSFSSKEIEEDKKEELPDVEDITSSMKLAFEKELLGIYLSGHPLDEYRDVIEQDNSVTLAVLNEVDEETGEFKIDDNKSVEVAGILRKINKKMTKNGTKMAFATLEDITSQIELVIFPATYDRFQNLIEEDSIVVVRGRTNVKEDEGCKVLVQEIRKLVKKESDIKLELVIDSIKDKSLLENLEKILRLYEGEEKIQIRSRDDNKVRFPKIKVRLDKDLIRQLGFLLGDNNVISK